MLSKHNIDKILIDFFKMTTFLKRTYIISFLIDAHESTKIHSVHISTLYILTRKFINKITRKYAPFEISFHNL